MKIFVTKYALSTGIFTIDADIRSSGLARENKRVVVYFSEDEYTLTKEEAIAQAEKMRIKKILSIEKSLKKIKAIDFTKIKEK